MIRSIAKKVFGSYNDRFVKKMQPFVDSVNQLEQKIQILSDEELAEKTDEFRKRLADGETHDEIMAEAFAVVRQAGIRQLNMRHFDVQLIGGHVLHSGKIAEMKTGEGKTLVATLALYLNAIEGKGAHLVTVNDYLARRDAMWMAPIYLSLGLSVGVIQHDGSFHVEWDLGSEYNTKLTDCSREEAYAADITYGTNNEFGFDYLRDNMKYELKDMAQKNLNFAIVDEVDSILIDEARTPLIISGPTDESTEKYYNIDQVVRQLDGAKHYKIDEKARTATLTDEGITFVEEKLDVGNLFEVTNVETLHFVNNSLKAWTLFRKDTEYVVKNGEVIIVDEFTGRLMPGRRYSDGLHQAIEAKEGVKIENENQTLASITFQNFFRMYDKLSGMTGTAATEAQEFMQIYNLGVVSIPTNKMMVRVDHPDVIYKTVKEKFIAIADEIAEMQKQGRPVLVGTNSIEKSELISSLLNKKGVKHNVLNAKQHEKEAEIVKNAGQAGAITIATNMAGRGTDIKLGAGVLEKGGLHILGSERNESRRVDNQLRGRAGRQGDAGSSRFFLSLEDDLLRIFGSDKIKYIMNKLGIDDGEPIEHNMISKAIENAQKKVEGMHFEIRKHLLDYDNVMNQQRTIVYDMRRGILDGEEVDTIMGETIENVLDSLYNMHVEAPEVPDIEELNNAVEQIFDIEYKFDTENKQNLVTEFDEFKEKVQEKYREKKEEFGAMFINVTKFLLINILDSKWKEHLLHMDYLRDSVGLRGYGQKDPLNEYKREAFNLFTDMMTRVNFDITEFLFHVKLQTKELELEHEERTGFTEERRDIFAQEDKEDKKTPVRRDAPKVGRNDPCPCGSGKKYKKCCGASENDTADIEEEV